MKRVLEIQFNLKFTNTSAYFSMIYFYDTFIRIVIQFMKYHVTARIKTFSYKQLPLKSILERFEWHKDPIWNYFLQTSIKLHTVEQIKTSSCYTFVTSEKTTFRRRICLNVLYFAHFFQLRLSICFFFSSTSSGLYRNWYQHEFSIFHQLDQHS